MTQLPPRPSLSDLQTYIAAVCQERGWTEDTWSEKFVLFSEEIGELAKAMRRKAALYDEPAKKGTLNLEEEFADVLSYLLDLANHFQIDLEKAFRAKEKINETRVWK